MSDDRGLLQAVCEFPADDLPRLAYADWCEEQGDDDRAEFIRLQCLIAGIEATCSCGACVRKRGGGQHTNGPCAVDRHRIGQPDGRSRQAFLRRRERELFIAAGPGQLKWFGPLQAVLPVGTPVSSLLPWFRRGFIAEIRLPLDDFLKHAGTIFTNHPIERVVLTDREPHFEIEWYDGDRRKADGILNAIHLESDLPTVLFDLLEGHSTYFRYMDMTYFRYVDMKSYPPEKTKVKPMEALSNACVAYGRSLTWDKAPGKRIKDMKGKVGRVT